MRSMTMKRTDWNLLNSVFFNKKEDLQKTSLTYLNHNKLQKKLHKKTSIIEIIDWNWKRQLKENWTELIQLRMIACLSNYVISLTRENKLKWSYLVMIRTIHLPISLASRQFLTTKIFIWKMAFSTQESKGSSWRKKKTKLILDRLSWQMISCLRGWVPRNCSKSTKLLSHLVQISILWSTWLMIVWNILRTFKFKTKNK